jgi:hypothetical protein
MEGGLAGIRREFAVTRYTARIGHAEKLDSAAMLTMTLRTVGYIRRNLSLVMNRPGMTSRASCIWHGPLP